MMVDRVSNFINLVHLQVVRIILTDSGSLENVTWQQLVLFGLYTIGYCVGPFIGGELITVSFRWIFAIK